MEQREPVFSGEVSAHVAAPPEVVYDLVSDVSRMGEWSPETVSAQWVEGSGPAVGARFRGTNKAGIARWSTTVTVLAADRGREFAFRTRDTVWRYVFEPDGAGTRVTESFSVEKYNALFTLVSPVRRRQPAMVEGMRQTLERLRAAAEATAG